MTLRSQRPAFSGSSQVQHHIGEALSLNQDMVTQPLGRQLFVSLADSLHNAGMFGERLSQAIARSQLNATVRAQSLVEAEGLFCEETRLRLAR